MAKKVEVAATAELEHSLSPTWVHLVKVAQKHEHMARPPKINNLAGKFQKMPKKGWWSSAETVTAISYATELDISDKIMTLIENVLPP